MPSYSVTVELPNLPKGATVEVPPIGVVENGTVNEVYLTTETADYLATNENIKVKKTQDIKADDVKKLADKATTLEELDLLFVGEERAAVVDYLTARRVELAGPPVERESQPEATPQDSMGPLTDVAVQTPAEGGES